MDPEESEEQVASDAKDVKRKKKTPLQIETLEKVYAEDKHPSEAVRMQLSFELGLTNRQLQMWFCNRRLKDRKGQKEESHSISHDELEDRNFTSPKNLSDIKEYPAAVLASEVEDAALFGKSGVKSQSQKKKGSLREGRASKATKQKVLQESPVKELQSSFQELDSETADAFVAFTSSDSWRGEPYRKDGPLLGFEFDPLPPGAFETSVESVEERGLMDALPAKDGMKHEMPDIRATDCVRRAKPADSNSAKALKEGQRRECNKKSKPNQLLHDVQKPNNGDKSHVRMVQASREKQCPPSKRLAVCQKARRTQIGNGLENKNSTRDPDTRPLHNSNTSNIPYTEQCRQSAHSNSIHTYVDMSGGDSWNRDGNSGDGSSSSDGPVDDSEENKGSAKSCSDDDVSEGEEGNVQHKGYCYNSVYPPEEDYSARLP